MSQSPRWVVCTSGTGNLHDAGKPEPRTKKFMKNAVALVKECGDDSLVVWVIGADQDWTVRADEVRELDVLSTGDGFSEKICNLCHRLLPVASFDPNQVNKRGVVRRPSCKRCRADIDKRAPKSRQAKAKERVRPSTGSPFKCPICHKRSIIGVTARIVADHDHRSGDIRDFICDSCNTGLGRFKDDEDVLENAIMYLRERDSYKVAASVL